MARAVAAAVAFAAAVALAAFGTTGGAAPAAAAASQPVPNQQIGTGIYQSCMLNYGVPYCWGFNGSGSLGDGTTIDRSTPVPVNLDAVPATETMVRLSVGLMHGCMLSSAGS